MGIGHRRFLEEESTFRHQTFDLWHLGVEKKEFKFMKKNSESHSQSHSIQSYYWTHLKCHSENHLESN